jgi:hypothetical protein
MLMMCVCIEDLISEKQFLTSPKRQTGLLELLQAHHWRLECKAGVNAQPAQRSSMMREFNYLQGLGVGMGMVQSIVAAMLDVVPPLIPPPAWNNMPLPCAPMITGAARSILAICYLSGHNCFGAVLYPITMADFAIADVTDAMLDGAASIACPWSANATVFKLPETSRIHCRLPKYLRRESWEDRRRSI